MSTIWRETGSSEVVLIETRTPRVDSFTGGARNALPLLRAYAVTGGRTTIDVIHEQCGEAAFVFDTFLIFRHFIEAIDTVRKMETKALAETGCKALKGTTYIWLKNPWNLTDNQKITLSELLKSSFKIVRACLLKELFRRLWDFKSKALGAKYLKRWFWPACALHAKRWAAL
jgi:transposase